MSLIRKYLVRWQQFVKSQIFWAYGQLLKVGYTLSLGAFLIFTVTSLVKVVKWDGMPNSTIYVTDENPKDEAVVRYGLRW